MRSLIRAAFVTAAALSLSACGQNQGAADATRKIQALEAELNLTKERLTVTESRLDGIETAAAGDEGELAGLKMDLGKYEGAELDPTTARYYMRVDTDAGTFLVSIANVQPYLDGVKLTLEIGNIQSVSYSGYVVTAEYGVHPPRLPPSATWQAEYHAYQKSLKTISETHTDTLLPGRWNTAVIILPNIKPVAFGDVSISLKVDTVALSR